MSSLHFFEPRESEPVIIDCGANIGVSVLEWKTRWPMSRIICFEPDPDAFRLLTLNVERNDIPGVQCIHAAVTDFDGTTSLFGDMGHGADARGNSIHASWGQRENSDSVEVTCCKLSPYLAKHDVSFLKIDIEGAEESVLRESLSALQKVDALYVEVHETDEMMEQNSSDSYRKAVVGILLSDRTRIAVSSSFTATRPKRMATECQCKSDPVPCLA